VSGLGQDDVPVLVGTLGKAFGTFGAFVAGPSDLIDYLIQKARTYIYTTALPPALAEASRTSLRLALSENWRRQRLADLVRRFRAGATDIGLNVMNSGTPIQPVVLGLNETVIAMGRHLLKSGFLVGTIRPPTVPKDTARLRITLSAAHTDDHVDGLLDSIRAFMKQSHDIDWS
jgi:8-amino-7-oxononanoate synthase